MHAPPVSPHCPKPPALNPTAPVLHALVCQHTPCTPSVSKQFKLQAPPVSHHTNALSCTPRSYAPAQSMRTQCLESTVSYDFLTCHAGYTHPQCYHAVQNHQPYTKPCSTHPSVTTLSQTIIPSHIIPVLNALVCQHSAFEQSLHHGGHIGLRAELFQTQLRRSRVSKRLALLRWGAGGQVEAVSGCGGIVCMSDLCV